MKTVDSEVCGLLRVMGTPFLGTDCMLLNFFKHNFFNAPQTKFHSSLYYFGGGIILRWISQNF